METRETAQKPRRTVYHELGGIVRTIGGIKVKANDLFYAVYTDGSPAGISGYIWWHHRYMGHRWTDEGISKWAECYPELNIQIPTPTTLAA